MKVLRKDQLPIVAQLLVSLILIRYALFKNIDLKIALSDFEFLLFIISFALIYAGGMLLYTIVKQEEHPEKIIIKNTEKAYYTYLGLNTLGIGISFFLANAIGNAGYLGFFIFLAALLYLYTTQWRKIVLFSNIIFAFVIAYPIFVGCILDIMPNLGNSLKINTDDLILMVILNFAILITFLFFIKTLILDLKFVSIDKRKGKKTLATLHGVEVGSKRTSYLILLPIVMVLFFIFSYYQKLQLLSIYCGVVIILPLIFLMYQLNKSEKTKEFNTSNNILNVIIWLTIFSIVVLLFNLKYYVTS